jgi:nucleotide-binding universal stress UspA family protein
LFPTKILLASDGSAEAIRAARMAITLSEKLDSELHVAYVEPLPDHFASPESITYHTEYRHELRKIAERDAHDKLGKEAQKIRDMGEVTETHARVGRPDAEIVRLAEEIGAGLVVLGSRGLGPIRRALMGSVSSSVVRHAHCSVLVVRESGDGGGSELPRKILLAVDGSEGGDAAARSAVDIAGAADSELHVLYVMQTERYIPYPGPEAWEWAANLERAKRHARSWVEGQGRRIQAERAKSTKAHLAFGKPDQEIVKLGEDLHAGLVVVGSRGLGALRRVLIGSVSDSVVRHAQCSVLVVRGQEQTESRGSTEASRA